MMDYRLNTFLTLCITKNYTHAAKKLNITQPAVTQHIKYLEGKYNTNLFYYDEHRKLHLTPAGKELRDFAVSIQADNARLKSSIEQHMRNEDEIKIGTIQTLGEAIAPAIITAYLEKYPNKKINMYLGEADDLLTQLQNGRIHFCLTDIHCPSTSYESYELFRTRTSCLCSPNHPLAEQLVDFKALNKYRLVFRENDTYSKRNLMRILKSNNQDHNHFTSYVEAGSIHAVKRLIQSDVGISFIYRFVAQEELNTGRLKEIYVKNFHTSHFLNLAWVKNSFYSDRNKEFLIICRNVIEEYFKTYSTTSG